MNHNQLTFPSAFLGVGYNSCIDIIPGLAPFRLVDFFYTHSISSPVFDLVSKAFSRAKESHRVLVNSFYDLEKSIVDALRKEGILIEPIGPLISLSGDESSTHMLREKDKLTVTSMSLYASEEDCLDWLNKQEAGSVIYVSFGSMVKIGKDEIQELIKGLEGSEQPYLLVVRPDMHFMECRETSSRGRVCCWAPQVRVLGHPAVSGFLTHCGWNSIIESICMGVPMIGCPQESEQHTNFKFMRDEWRVAIGLDNWQCLCDEPLASRTKIEGKAVQRAVMNLMRGEDGIQLRERMRNLQQSALSHVRARSTVLQALLAGMQDDHLP
ncbi:hypothetical protein KP509_02G108600 [Ceratopteris richardii]|uniref:UDP-glycosyltransferases domain-containing protein n=1 Tax=Ceratopteris richardii TaxID=49495 RepID=A0A8T2VHL1_CERRI|nr:hypothetical protein KP509_02G108600 [Ceratopteris richardii]